MASDADTVLSRIPSDGTTHRANLLGDLKWARQRLEPALQSLIGSRKIIIGRGRGGTISRVPKLSPSHEVFLEHLDKAEGDPIPNGQLRRVLGLSESDFWTLRNDLVTWELAYVGRGQGGSTGAWRRRGFEAGRGDFDPRVEETLYAPIRDVLKLHFFVGSDEYRSVVDITARQGSRSTGGRWTRPDITAVERQRCELVGAIGWDVYTFEVKPCDNWDITCVHEAHAHGRNATRPYSFLLATDLKEPGLLAVRDEAVRLGVGLIVATDVRDYDTWRFLVEPERHPADPISVEEFLAQQLSSDAQATIRSWGIDE
jgi:hypothetical protein